MMKLFRFAGAVLAALFLVACNGAATGGGQQGGQQAGANSDMTPIQTFDNTERDLNDLPNTAFRDMPSRGAARFDGAAQITIDPVTAQDRRRRYVGEVEVTVDFSRDGLVGQIDNFVTRGSGRAVAGQVYITQGDLAVTRPNDLSAEYAGNLRDKGDRISITGQMQGDFRGTPIRGLAASNAGAGARVNGADTMHEFEMFVIRR